MKIIIIANRLPVKIERDGEEGFSISRSEGGLATGLGSLETDSDIYWVGWPGIHTENEEEKKVITERLHDLNFHPVFLSDEHIENYYEGYSNSTIWPLCHYFFSFIEYKADYWAAYQEVNNLFAREALPFIENDDVVWVQDYQLMLLPKLLRDEKPKANIGYFHHIPFPSYELFRVLPEREEVLEGLLGADLIGFHTHDYMRHFISAIYRVLDLNCTLDEINLDNRIVHVDAFPMGINYDQYRLAPKQPEVINTAKKLKQKLENKQVILSVDRLDYSKGILHRLDGFAQFLDNHPEYHEKVSLAMIVVPSRDNVEMYADLKTKIDQSIGEINGKYSKLGWTPIYYFYRAFSFEELIAMYDIAEIALVSPLRDGMNLVAKEYLATKHDKPGVLILSEMAGAAIELPEAIIINPNDTDQIESAILKALHMPKEEKKQRLHSMQKRISTQTVQKWANDFVKELQSIKAQNQEILQKIVGRRQLNQIKSAYDEASARLILLDYDGTLAPFVKKPEDAVPSPRLLELLKEISSDEKNKVVINSGRNHQILEQWFEGFTKPYKIIPGGAERQDSVFSALKACPEGTEYVAIHDGVRPFVTLELIELLFAAVTVDKAVVPASKLKHTVMQIEDNYAVRTINRNQLVNVFTPQVFEYALIMEAYIAAYRNNFYSTDDASLIQNLGERIRVLWSDDFNIKITDEADLFFAKQLIEKNKI